jgi:hypothetical protein
MTQKQMSLAKARFIIRSELLRIHKDAGPQAAGDLANAIEALVQDAIKNAITARANQ